MNIGCMELKKILGLRWSMKHAPCSVTPENQRLGNNPKKSAQVQAEVSSLFDVP